MGFYKIISIIEAQGTWESPVNKEEWSPQCVLYDITSDFLFSWIGYEDYEQPDSLFDSLKSFKNRGLPEDMSRLTRALWKTRDWGNTTVSWLSFEEIEETLLPFLKKYYESKNDPEGDKVFEALMLLMRQQTHLERPLRLIFWKHMVWDGR